MPIQTLTPPASGWTANTLATALVAWWSREGQSWLATVAASGATWEATLGGMQRTSATVAGLSSENPVLTGALSSCTMALQLIAISAVGEFGPDAVREKKVVVVTPPEPTLAERIVAHWTTGNGHQAFVDQVVAGITYAGCMDLVRRTTYTALNVPNDTAYNDALTGSAVNDALSAMYLAEQAADIAKTLAAVPDGFTAVQHLRAWILWRYWAGDGKPYLVSQIRAGKVAPEQIDAIAWNESPARCNLPADADTKRALAHPKVQEVLNSILKDTTDAMRREQVGAGANEDPGGHTGAPTDTTNLTPASKTSNISAVLALGGLALTLLGGDNA